MFVSHHCITVFGFGHLASTIFPRVCWNALQPVGFVSVHQLQSSCHRGRRPGDQVLQLLSRLIFTMYEKWKLFGSVWSWGTLECFISQQSGTVPWRGLELWMLLWGEAWMVLSRVDNYSVLISLKRGRSTRVIKLLKRAWKCSLCYWLQEKCYSPKATDMDVKTARHLKDFSL